MFRDRVRGPSLELLVLWLIGLAAASAHANDGPRRYSLTGKFVSNQGRLVNFPLIGDVACPSIVLLSDAPPGTAGYFPRPANRYGCIPVKGKVTTTGKGVGGAFVMPPNVFAQPAHSSNGLPKHWLPVKNAPPIKQISTSDAFLGPPVERTLPAGQYADGMNTAVFRLFRANAWSTQTGRVGSQFTWCPGGCTSGQSRAVVTYHPRQSRFGGTMSLLISPGPNGSRLVLQAGAGGIGTNSTMIGNVIFAPFGSYGTQATGAGYAVKRTQLPPGPASVFAKYMTNMTEFMRITMGTSFVGTLPLPSRRQVGFPWTTGTVVVRYRLNGGSTTLTAAGGDVVTPMGARNISLVAGGITVDNESALAVSGTANLSQLLLPEPGAAGLVATVIALLGISATRARSHRR